VKFDDKPQHNASKTKTISPQSAMNAYFEDMFGSAEEDPLKKLSESQSLSAEESSSKAQQETLNIKVNKHELSSLSKNLAAERYNPKPKKQILHFNAPDFDEPEMIAGRISPLIIPAAFPKLAPVKPKTTTEAKTITEAKTVTDVENKLVQTLKTKLDAKTALALLEKQKSKLSSAQRLRLDEKLKILAKAKSQAVTQTLNETEVLEKTNIVKPEIKTTKPFVSEQKIVETQSKKVNVKTINEVQTEEALRTKATEKLLSPEAVLQKSDRPDWANSRFECLIFTVAGLKLAVPLISLGAIYKIEKEFIPLVGRANWFLGLYHHLERNVRVIDTAQLVMPERCSEEVRFAYKFIIRLGGNDWGMACDAVHQSIQLSPDQVKWRTERTKRAWLLGTVIDHMCALIDADSLSSMLNDQANRNPRIIS
tara:strand:- start:86845 stop:88116 length:1272 start_codon:yes stop_codon:yes gene_type:complete